MFEINFDISNYSQILDFQMKSGIFFVWFVGNAGRNLMGGRGAIAFSSDIRHQTSDINQSTTMA
jgi:hypothetical protein